MFLSRYQDRQSALKVEHEVVDNGREGKVHSLNEFDITVWSDGEVTARRKYYASSDPKNTFPNMSFDNGSINLPIEDLVSFILARITPAELADGLMADDEAREALVYKMSERYSDISFEDEDRRKFLTKVQQQIHAKSVDRAIERLNKAEEAHRSRDDYYRWKDVELGNYRTLYEYTESLLAGDAEKSKNFIDRHIHPDRLKEYIKSNRDPVVTESVGPEWHESRDFWRSKLLECFPSPEEPRP